MTTPNENTPPPVTPAPAPAPAATPAPAPAPAVPSSGSGGGGRDPLERIQYLEQQNAQLISQRDEYKGKIRESENTDFQAELSAKDEQLKEKTDAEARLLGRLKERNRVDARGQFVEAILARVPEGQRADVDLRLAGLQQKGELSIPDEIPDDATPADIRKLATDAAAEALTTLVDSYPGWFAGGSTGVGTPRGPGGGPMPEDWMALDEETRRNMSDEDFEKHYGSKRTQKKRKTLLG